MYAQRELERVSGLDRKSFKRLFEKPAKPVIIEDYAFGWPALEKWSFEYFKQKLHDRVVPLYDSSKADYSKKINEASLEMSFGDYIDLIQAQPTDLRIFLFNIFKEEPSLCDDFFASPISPAVLTHFPMMFFGGKGATVFMHYDIDMSHVFHTHFGGDKQVILFDHKDKKFLYHLPFSVHTIEDIDVENPDLERWPAMGQVQGYKAILHHGDTLFMPGGMWHRMKYLNAGFSLSLRALNNSWFSRAKGLYNLSVLRYIDNTGRKIGGERWMAYKEAQAIHRANQALIGA